MLATANDVEVDVTDPGSIADRLTAAAEDLLGSFAEQLPLIALSVVVLVLGLVIGRFAVKGVDRLVVRSRFDSSVSALVHQVARVLFFVLASLLALSVAGFDVGSALAALGIAGLAIAFAVQSILENFIAGILILLRRPFRPGDQIRIADFEGTCETVNLRVTRLRDYDGETVLVPNAQVLSAPIVNLTEAGMRRTRVAVGVDYRDDHVAAREVVRAAAQAADGVMEHPPAEAFLVALGSSSVDIEVRFWSRPDIASVVRATDAVIADVKTAIEGAGMTIPWPIRTLVMDDALEVRRGSASDV